MAHKKGVGSSKNGRESASQRLGVKIWGGQKVIAGNFTVTRDSYGVRVEKLFPFNSPWLQGIKLVKKGEGWRAKLYTERTFCSHKAVRKLVKK